MSEENMNTQVGSQKIKQEECGWGEEEERMARVGVKNCRRAKNIKTCIDYL